MTIGRLSQHNTLEESRVENLGLVRSNHFLAYAPNPLAPLKVSCCQERVKIVAYVDQHLGHVEELGLVRVLYAFDDFLDQLGDLLAYSDERLLVIKRSPMQETVPVWLSSLTYPAKGSSAWQLCRVLRC